VAQGCGWVTAPGGGRDGEPLHRADAQRSLRKRFQGCGAVQCRVKPSQKMAQQTASMPGQIGARFCRETERAETLGSLL